MTYSIYRDKLVEPGVSYMETSKRSEGKLMPKFLLIHYTASDNFAGDVRVLSTSDRPASCHLVVGPQGQITQIGTFTDVLWHAGKSAWKGYVGLNKYSIGIEVTCPGPLDGQKMWTGRVLQEAAPFAFVFAKHKNGLDVARNWALFTEAQLDVVIEVGTLLMRHYELIEAVGHDDVSPGRKQDPGPSCPVSVFHALNGNRSNVEEVERPDLVSTTKTFQVVGVAPETLTFRASPNGEKRGELHQNAIVEEITRQGNWVQVRTLAGHVGWVYGKYLSAQIIPTH